MNLWLNSPFLDLCGWCQQELSWTKAIFVKKIVDPKPWWWISLFPGICKWENDWNRTPAIWKLPTNHWLNSNVIIWMKFYIPKWTPIFSFHLAPCDSSQTFDNTLTTLHFPYVFPSRFTRSIHVSTNCERGCIVKTLLPGDVICGTTYINHHPNLLNHRIVSLNSGWWITYVNIAATTKTPPLIPIILAT